MVAEAAVATATTVASLVTFPATAPSQGREAAAVAAAVVAVTATTATNPAISPGTAPNPGREVVEVDAEVEAVAAATCNATSAAATVTCPASARLRSQSFSKERRQSMEFADYG